MTEQVKVYAILTAKEGRGDELAELLATMTAPSRAEAGNLRYNLWRDVEQESRFVLDELYRDDISASAHKASPHFQHYRSKINGLADRIVVTVSPVDVV